MSGGSRARALIAPNGTPESSARRAPLRVVATHHRRRRTIAAAVAVATVFGVLLMLVAAQTVLMGSQARIDQLNKDIAAAKQWQQRGQLMVDELESPSAIVTAARDRLHLVQPAQPTYLTPSADIVREVMEAQRQALQATTAP